MSSFIFRQLFDSQSSTYTYLLGDHESREAILIDTVREQVNRDLSLISEMGLKLSIVLETHIHADHITGAGQIRERTKAKIFQAQESHVTCADELFTDKDLIPFGSKEIECLFTPGHTENSYCFGLEDRLFTGDTLLIRGCGRTDFQVGSAPQLFHSVNDKIYRWPDETLVFPGHDYKGRTCSSVGEEKKHNKRLFLGQTEEEFTQLMKDLKLSPPKLIDQAVPANMNCGLSAA